MTVGAHVVTLHPFGGGAPVDLSCLVDQVGINHGRDDGDQPARWPPRPLSPVPGPQRRVRGSGRGSRSQATVVVTTTVGGTTGDARFTGVITDIDLEVKRTLAPTLQRPASGRSSAWTWLRPTARRVVGDVPAQEPDGARVSRIMAAADVILNPATSDPGTAQVLARDVDAWAALGLSQDAATSASGIVWQTRDGEIRYADASHRRGTPSSLTLDACDVLITPRWKRTVEGMINAASIGSAVAPDVESNPATSPRTTLSDRRLRRIRVHAVVPARRPGRRPSPRELMAYTSVQRLPGVDHDRAARRRRRPGRRPHPSAPRPRRCTP